MRKEKEKKGLGLRTLFFIFSIMRGHILFLIINGGIFSDDPSFLPHVYKFPKKTQERVPCVLSKKIGVNEELVPTKSHPWWPILWILNPKTTNNFPIQEQRVHDCVLFNN